MEIAPLTEDDLAALAELYRQFWGEESSLEKMRATFRHLANDPSYLLLAARRDGQLVGSAMGIVCRELYGDCRPFLVVEDVVVDKSQRRDGIGSALMHELERLAIEHDCSQVIFVTESDRTDAHRFYESLGYQPDEYRGFKKRLRNREDASSSQSGAIRTACGIKPQAACSNKPRRSGSH